jgi:hypothetical protein
MTINAGQFAAQIVIPTLELLDREAGIAYSELYFHLVIGTIAQESLLGTFLVQTSGPALGIGQIEPQSLTDLIASLGEREAGVLATLATPAPPAHNVVGNLPYAVAVTRLFYRHKPGNPAADTVSAHFQYYKRWYNTPAGAATLAQWKQNWALTGISIPFGTVSPRLPFTAAEDRVIRESWGNIATIAAQLGRSDKSVMGRGRLLGLPAGTRPRRSMRA